MYMDEVSHLATLASACIIISRNVRSRRNHYSNFSISFSFDVSTAAAAVKPWKKNDD